MTSRQRAKVSRQNALKSTGPKTPEGKAKSRQNALKHGLTARVLALPNEDPEIILEKREFWHDRYQPEGVAETLLIDHIAITSITLGRCIESVHSLVAMQVRNAERDWDKAQHQRVMNAVALMEKDPVGAGLELRSFAAGARWLLEEWDFLGRSSTIDPAVAARVAGKRRVDERVSPTDLLAAATVDLTAILPSLEADGSLDRAEAPIRARTLAESKEIRQSMRYLKSAETTLDRSMKALERYQTDRFEAIEFAEEVVAENEAGYAILARPKYDPNKYYNENAWRDQTRLKSLRRKAEESIKYFELEERAIYEKNAAGSWDT